MAGIPGGLCAAAGGSLARCGQLHGDLRFGTIDDIFERGLHEYLSEFLERIYDLGDLINTTYFWSTDEWPSALPMAQQSFKMPLAGQMMAR